MLQTSSALLLLLTPLVLAIQPWQPVLHPDLYTKDSPSTSYSGSYHSGALLSTHGFGSSSSGHTQGQCDLYKVGFTQDLYFQYIQYKLELPELKEFTLCHWNKFTNHTNDHPIFSYAVDGQPRAMYAWISNTERSSYFSLAVEGHTLYRLNYPLRLNRWYHACQSWNGKTGEWQIWVNAERVGRGFYNRLVGHSISSGGIALSGQEQSQTGGGFQEGKYAPKGAGGMLGEITMVQLYSVALTAGKAHKDHKHHHAHKFDKAGQPITTPPPPTPAPRPPQPTHPLLTGGQLNPNVALNIAANQRPQFVQGQQYNTQYLNGQFANSLVSRQLQITGQGPQTFQGQQLQQQQQQELPNDITSYSQQSLTIGGLPILNSGLVHSTASGTIPQNVQFIDNSQSELQTHQLFKRDVQAKTKRELYVASNGQLVDDSLLTQGGGFDQSLLSGLAGIGQNEPVLEQQKQSEEREPAEAEVMAVMNVCNGCDAEPFGKALVFGWRTVSKKLYSGAFYTPAVPECRVF